jgi:hypothetical protein
VGREASIRVSRPPLAVVLAAVAMLALGETGGAAMSQLRPAIERYAAARVDANREAHGLTGAAEYDDEVRERAIYTAEAGLSFFHTHAEGMALVLFFASTLVATVVPGRAVRAMLYTLLTAGALFPLGYLCYGLAVLELGRDAGLDLAEVWVLTPLGLSAMAGLAGLAIALGRAVRRARRPGVG